MKISSRELTLMLLTGSVALFGGTAILGRSRFEMVKSLAEQQVKLRQEIERSDHLIQQQDRWTRLFAELGKMIPQFPADKRMDVYWLAQMDEVASRHGMVISQRRAGEEKKVGEVYELPIDVRDWDGKLESVVHFMFDMQSGGAMLDLRQVYMKPKEDRSLHGRFTLYCAYTKASSPAKAASVPAATNAPAVPAVPPAGGPPQDKKKAAET